MSTATLRRYSPRGTALALFGCRDPEVLMSGPAGTGKSRACLEKLHAMAMKNPGMKGLIVRKNESTLASTALASYRADVAAQNLADGDVRWFGGSPSKPKGFQYANGSTLTVAGMDRATKIMSSEYDVAYVQEAIELTENDWEAITTRLRNGRVSFQQLIADTNPSTPTHWLKQRADRGQVTMLNATHEENPTLFDQAGNITPGGKAYIGKLDALTGVRYQTLRRGLWVAAEGLIYDDLDPSVHFVDPFPVPADWPRYWAIDFGFTNPFVCQFWALDPDGRAFLYREIYLSGRIVEDHAKRLLEIVRPNGPGAPWIEPRPTRIVADHDAEGRATFTRHLGMSTTAANKKVTEGIQAVQARLKNAGDGRPRLFLMRSVTDQVDQLLLDRKKPTSTVDEMPGYIWDIGSGKQPKEQPLKENDHGMDAMRYFVADRDLGGVYRMRSVG